MHDWPRSRYGHPFGTWMTITKLPSCLPCFDCSLASSHRLRPLDPRMDSRVFVTPVISTFLTTGEAGTARVTASLTRGPGPLILVTPLCHAGLINAFIQVAARLTKGHGQQSKYLERGSPSLWMLPAGNSNHTFLLLPRSIQAATWTFISVPRKQRPPDCKGCSPDTKRASLRPEG